MELKLKKTELKTLSMDLTTLPAELTPMVAGGNGQFGASEPFRTCMASEGETCPTGGETTCVVEC